MVNGREIRKVGIGKVGGDVPFLDSGVGEGDPSGISLFDEARMVISGTVLMRDGGGAWT